MQQQPKAHFSHTHSVVIPAFNEQAAIGASLQALCSDPRLQEVEFIVVNDGSSDDTAKIAAEFSPRVTLVNHSCNRGYSSALVSGMLAAKGQFVSWMDADGQHRIEDLVAVLETLDKGDCDYCIGVREKQSHRDRNRIFGKWILKMAVNFAARTAVPDFNSGLRGFKREIILRYLKFLPQGFGASTTTTLLMQERNYKVVYVPIIVMQRQGKSSVKVIRDGMRTLMLILRIFLLFRPFSFFGGIGAGLTLLGFFYGLWVAISEASGFPTLGVMIILFGVQSFFFGLIMDSLSAMRREALTPYDKND